MIHMEAFAISIYIRFKYNLDEFALVFVNKNSMRGQSELIYKVFIVSKIFILNLKPTPKIREIM